MRIVHFDQMFHPDFGDQINVLPKYQVIQGHEVYIVTGKSDVPHPRFKGFADNSNMDEKDMRYENETGIKIIRIDIKKFVSGRAVFKKGYTKIIDRLNPDILFCHFNDTLVGMHYTWISNKLKYPIIFDTHMLEMASKNRFNKLFRFFYKTFITPKIKKNKLKVIKTQDDNYINDKLGIPHNLSPFISFGSDTTLFYPDLQVREKFRERNGILESDFVVVYTGKLTESKGGKLLAEAFLEKIERVNNVVLVVVGNSEGEYGKEVDSLFSKSRNRILRFPTQKYIDLPQFYQMADLCVFPKQCSLSFYDAQACGLPVVAEDNNINIDRLSHNNGLVFRENESIDLRRMIITINLMSDKSYKTMSENAFKFIKNNYSYEDIANQYTKLMKKEVARYLLDNKIKE